MSYDYIRPNGKLIKWLLEGDPAIVYQVNRDLLDTGINLNALQQNIALEGWGKKLLDAQGKDGLWGRGYYSPKWVSTHYTILQMMRIGFPSDHMAPKVALMKYLNEKFSSDMGIDVSATSKKSDVCVTAMVLSMLCYFKIVDDRMSDMLTYFEKTRLYDGGWNCNHAGGDFHSSVHTTLSVLDALERARRFGIKSNVDVDDLINSGMTFMLNHKLYQSHRAGQPMQKQFTRFSFPPRWFFDVMKAMDQFQMHDVPQNENFDDSLKLICKKQRKSGKWTVQNKHAGREHFEMEKAGQESRWNTLRALRILKKYGEV